jgi:hypothetical protein
LYQHNRNNNEASAIGAIVGFVGMIVVFVAIIALAIAAFLTFVVTLICIVSWNSETRIGNQTFEPDWARAFVQRGLAGAALFPAFIAFCGVALTPLMDGEFHWEPTYWLYTMGLGYMGGSLGIEILRADDDDGSSDEPAAPLWITPPPPLAEKPDPTSFQYASWEDDDQQSHRF